MKTQVNVQNTFHIFLKLVFVEKTVSSHSTIRVEQIVSQTTSIFAV